MDDGRRVTHDASRLPFDVARIAPVVLSGLLIAVFYGYALRLPFYFDDLPVLEWLEDHNLTEVWTVSNENAYYRPLTFSLYKLALSLPKGAQQKVLHGTNLLLHWAAAVLVGCLARRCVGTPDDGPSVAAGWAMDVLGACAAALYAVFPFFFRAVPWVTAMPHFLVVLLCLVAALAALWAEERGRPAWWVVSLAATALAPFAHESGMVCGAIVGGLVLLRPARASKWGRLGWVAGGIALNVGALIARSRLPGTNAFSPVGLESPLENALFGLHGLVYPLGTVIGALVRRGGHDLSLVGGAAVLCALLLAGLAWRTRSWRWIARALWWWGCASLPSLLAFRYGALVNSARFYALPAVGIVMLWAGAMARFAGLTPAAEGFRKRLGPGARSAIAITLSIGMVASNGLFLWQQRRVHRDLFGLYQQVIDVATPENAPAGYVNVPAWLTPDKQTYALVKESAIGLALYSDVRQLVRVNSGRPLAGQNVMHVHTLYEPADASFGFHGEWIEGESLRRFALDHGSVWQVRHRGGAQAGSRFDLRPVGHVETEVGACEGTLLARFEGGPELVAAATNATEQDARITLVWHAGAPVQASIFVHVVDARGALVTQADGPALGGLLPPALWQPGDCVYDVRTLDLPAEGGPFTVLVGLYDAQGRFAAFANGARVPNDAVPVAQITH